jgi:hypothetical protein
MESAKIEVAALEVQERIKKVDAAFTWSHPTDKGYFTTAVFVRVEDEKPYLIYCPRAKTAITIDEETYNPYLLWGGDSPYMIREVKLNQTLSQAGDILFYVIALDRSEKKVHKLDIEKMFGIKVVG